MHRCTWHICALARADLIYSMTILLNIRMKHLLHRQPSVAGDVCKGLALRLATPGAVGRNLATKSASSDKMVFSTSFTSIANARDLAETAYGIQPGKVCRSGNPSSATLEDCARLRKDFGIRHFVDLRSREEHALDKGWHDVMSNGTILTYSFQSHGIQVEEEVIPEGGLGASHCKMHRISLLEKKRFIRKLLWRLPVLKTLVALGFRILGYEAKMKEILLPEVNALGLPLVYEVILETAKNEIKSCLDRILDAQRKGEPVLIFCKLGKDRTGLLCALVLACCDVPLESILDDYSLSNNLDEIALGGIEKMEDVQGVDKSLFSSAPREAMAQTFKYIDSKYGSVHEYLDSIDFSYHLQKELKNLLIH